MAAGADGLMIEIHESPEKALCDGKQHITPEELSDLFASIRETYSICQGSHR
ncbi:DAHP synthetase I family protein [Chlamydia psittaci 03DC29]|nr:DAHP synthetase I family protein [Chlamydia psittaci 03DC29]